MAVCEEVPCERKTAEAQDTTRDGRLVIEDAQGVRHELLAGEITILY